jgi:hypothetical protein
VKAIAVSVGSVENRDFMDLRGSREAEANVRELGIRESLYMAVAGRV